MKVLNSNFTFTVKVGQEHFGGHFDYKKRNSEVVKMSFRKLPKASGNGYHYTQVNYLRRVNDEWVLWDMNRKAPKYNSKDDRAVYFIFREAYGLAQLH
jgi:hypothetical protein